MLKNQDVKWLKYLRTSMIALYSIVDDSFAGYCRPSLEPRD